MEANEQGQSAGEVFARRLREARGRLGWSQTELARRMGERGAPIHRATIAKIERGARTVSIDDMFAISATLGVSPIHMMIPLRDDEPIALTPTLTVHAVAARGWAFGMVPLVGASDEEGMAWLLERDEMSREFLVKEVPGLLSKAAREGVRPKTLSEAAREAARLMTDTPDTDKED